MPDPIVPGRIGLYLSMLHYGLTSNTEFAQEHCEFFRRFVANVGDIEGKRVLEVGCGKSFWLTLLLHSHGARATGIDTQNVEPGFGFARFREIWRHNGAERALRTAVWSLIFARPYYRALARTIGRPLRFDGIDVQRTAPDRLEFADDTFDLVVSHEVFEHIADVDAVARELRRVMKPGARTYIYVHNYTSVSGGHHIAWKHVDAKPSRKVPPWDHLRAKRFPFVPSWLNAMREHDYRPIMERYFEILDWFPTREEGRALLTPEIRAQLAEYSEQELLRQGFVIVATPRKPKPTRAGT